MDWQYPQALYLILPMCLGWLGIALYSQHRRRLAFSKFVAEPMWEKMMPKISSVRFWIKMVIKQIAIIASLIALAGPRYGDQFEQIIPRGSDLYVLIDVSRSMLADDVSPSRLGRAKADVASLVNRLEGERVGLIAFAGQAVVKCPLTVDYDSFRRALNELDTNSAPRGGTAIGDAIRKSLEVFQSNADRDQSILLITDGDDQQSYPREAAAAAAERHVTIFTLGLGDSATGSRIPQKGNSGAFIEHAGEQVWSKLDNSLLQEIAMKTSGVHIPAGTRSYDLGELYTQHLQGRRGNDTKAQQRITRSERFQIFLAVALFALLIDYCISPYSQSTATSVANSQVLSKSKRQAVTAATTFSLWLLFSPVTPSIFADDSSKQIREGMDRYSKQDFKKAIESFAAAAQELEKSKSDKVSIALFDEGCAFQRDGDREKARDRYLQAGLSKDRTIAVAAHFNIASLESDQAKEIAGDEPEEVASDKRKEVIDHLLKAIVAHRHCLELDPSHAASRRNIERIRQWIKFYSDRWNELDRQKRRDETNVFQFLEFIVKTQTDIRTAVTELKPDANLDTFAEWKRVQDELNNEMPFLRDKIESELRPPKQDDSNSKTSIPNNSNDDTDKEIEQAIALLQSWSDEARNHMATASEHLSKSSPSNASTEQESALKSLDKIWDAIVPFHPLLNKDISLQSAIVSTLPTKSPPPDPSESTTDATASPTPGETPPVTNDNQKSDEPVSPIEPANKTNDSTVALDPSNSESSSNDATLIDTAIDWSKLRTDQETALRKALLLRPKAESELAQFEAQQQQQQQQPADQEQQVDPEEVKAGYQKAIELAPSAVKEMESAINAMSAKDATQSANHAAEAKRILEEIQKAQPKSKQQQDQEQNDKDQQNQDKSEDEQNKSDKEQQQNKEDKKDDDKKEDKGQDDKKQENDQNKDRDKDKKDDKSQDNNKSNEKKQSPEVTQDRIEEALRKVREREQQKRERDKELKARILGRTPVDKDW